MYVLGNRLIGAEMLAIKTAMSHLISDHIMKSIDGSNTSTSARKDEMSHPMGLFSKLPAELRNLIWELVVLRDKRVVRFCSDLKEDEADSAEQPALTRTCSAIRNETIPMFYTMNNFFLEDIRSTRKWLGTLSKLNRERVDRVYISYHDWMSYGCRFFESQVPEVRYLRSSRATQLPRADEDRSEEYFIFALWSRDLEHGGT